MLLPHTFVFDDVFDFDITQLSNYEWHPFPQHSTPWYSNRVFHESTKVWDSNTPTICKDAYQISLDLFKQINPECTVNRTVRCMIHKYTPDTLMNTMDIHRDEFAPDYWSTIFYVDGTGPTDFFTSRDEESYVGSVDFKKGRVSIFPAGYWHRPSKQQNVDRIVIAFTFEVYNLVPEMNGVCQLCTCGKSPSIYCTGMHNPD